MGWFFDQIRSFDSFAKTHDDFRTKTVFGGLVTVASAVMIIGLLLWEWAEYQKYIWKPELIVDRSREQKMNIHFDIAFPRVPCFALTLDVMDAADQFQNNMHDHIVKTRLGPNGVSLGIYDDSEIDKAKGPDYCGKCGDVEIKKLDGSVVCCNTCSAVFAAHELKNLSPPNMDTVEQCQLENWPERIRQHSTEGCRMKGSFSVNKVSGNFHFAAGRSFDTHNYHLHDIRFLDGLHLDFSHNIHFLAFGDLHPEIKNPLDNTKIEPDPSRPEQTYSYYVKVVSTDFNYRNGSALHTNQFAVTKNEHSVIKGKASLPSAFFYYDISPMIVIYTEHKKPLVSFLSSVCAVIGGIYTISAIIDAFAFAAERHFRLKQAMGKVY